MRYSTFAVMLAATLLPGCASVVKGSSQTIAITTPPTDGAQCTLSSGQGNWQVTSPGAVTVSKSKDDMQVRCIKPGWQDGFGNIPSNFQGWTVGNLLIGGIIGLGVDAATGAINEYPNAFQVPMVPVAPPVPPMMPAPYPPPLPRRPGV
jgi:hypothetical protein